MTPGKDLGKSPGAGVEGGNPGLIGRATVGSHGARRGAVSKKMPTCLLKTGQFEPRHSIGTLRYKVQNPEEMRRPPRQIPPICQRLRKPASVRPLRSWPKICPKFHFRNEFALISQHQQVTIVSSQSVSNSTHRDTGVAVCIQVLPETQSLVVGRFGEFHGLEGYRGDQ